MYTRDGLVRLFKIVHLDSQLLGRVAVPPDEPADIARPPACETRQGAHNRRTRQWFPHPVALYACLRAQPSERRGSVRGTRCYPFGTSGGVRVGALTAGALNFSVCPDCRGVSTV